MIKSILLLSIYLLVSSIGLYRLKMSAAVMDVDFLVGFGLYGMGFLLWLYILRAHALSLVFPVAAGGLIVTTQVIGYLFLQEPFRVTRIAGTLFIIVGIILMYIQGEA
jgi:drug/metabolite transporter (DMT)-like permease